MRLRSETMRERWAREDREFWYKVAAGVAVVAAIVAIALWWNYNHTPVEGKVVHRQHSDAYWYITTTCSGNPMNCTTHNNYMPDSWELCIEGRDRHGRLAEDCVDVSKGSWFAHPEGTEWHR